jgi:hypothetical protein
MLDSYLTLTLIVGRLQLFLTATFQEIGPVWHITLSLTPVYLMSQSSAFERPPSRELLTGKIIL